jgi:hypothetical protein
MIRGAVLVAAAAVALILAPSTAMAARGANYTPRPHSRGVRPDAPRQIT